MPADAHWRTLPTRHLGRRLLACESADSTNDLAAGLAAGEAVLAREQTAGRGQHGRVWHCPPGAGLLLSARLDPPPEVRRPVLLTALVAVAVADAVHALAGFRPDLKWPNDLLAGGRKLCGILIEQRAVTVAGVGLNLRPVGLPGTASLADFGADVSPEVAAEAVLVALDDRYIELIAGDPSDLEAAWRDRLGLVGRIAVADLHDGSTVVGRVDALGFDRVSLATPGGVVSLAPERVRHIRAA
jgi:BirA family biotin operon repressor/biotin-[acetyl-CoA-carboxylase] ligase